MAGVLAALWTSWGIYQVIQCFRPYRRGQRLGYALGAVLSFTTATYILG